MAMTARMEPAPSFWRSAFERLVALLLFVGILPLLLGVGLLISCTAGSPVLLTDEVLGIHGRVARRYRFPTTGPGTPLFHFIGRFLRRYEIDELPSLWSVACGGIRLGEVWPLQMPK